MRENRCSTCDGDIKFIPYRSAVLPGKMFCAAICLTRYLQAKSQHDRALQLQPVQEGDACECNICRDP